MPMLPCRRAAATPGHMHGAKGGVGRVCRPEGTTAEQGRSVVLRSLRARLQTRAQTIAGPQLEALSSTMAPQDTHALRRRCMNNEGGLTALIGVLRGVAAARNRFTYSRPALPPSPQRPHHELAAGAAGAAGAAISRRAGPAADLLWRQRPAASQHRRRRRLSSAAAAAAACCCDCSRAARQRLPG